MQSVETVLALLGLTTFLAFLAHKANVPYPIFLVVGGMAVAFVPGLPSVSLDPQLVFLFFLPPILYAAGYFTSWRDFRANIVSISLLAVGLVVATTAAVAAVVVALVPGVPWPAALVLGAIVSPPDAVAATAIARRVHLPRQVVTVLEGESLVNDATGLVLLKFASAAIVTGHLAVLPGVGAFAVIAVGGVAVGIALGWLFAQAQRVLDDAILATTASLLFSFVAYVVAERLHVSGVLATVTAGVVQGRYVPRILSSRTRIESTSVWQTVIFLLNALVFVLIGLQLPRVLATLDWPWPTVVDGIFATFGTVVVVRLAWMFPGAYLPRYLFPKYRKTHPYPPWQAVVVVGWAGMRGVVSLAAALSLPIVLADGRPFPARSLIIFITFSVIFGTLVVQGLSLAPLVRWLRVEEDRSGEKEERAARLALAEAALEHLDGVMDERNLQAHQVHGVRQEYVQRVRSLRGLEGDGPAHAPLALSRELRRTAIEAQRRQLLKLRDEEVIGDDVLHRLQHELDLEDVRMR